MDEMEEKDILAFLRDDEIAEDKMILKDISDEDRENLLDRSDLIVNSSADVKPPVSTFPLKGPGWEVVIPTASGGMLSTLNN
ncbi:unnamed protein product [Lathyrus oleraceus]